MRKVVEKRKYNLCYYLLCDYHGIIILIRKSWAHSLVRISRTGKKKILKIYLTLINNWRDHTSFKLWLKCPLFCYRGVILMLQNFPTVFWNLWKIWRHTQVRDSRNSRPFTNTCVHSFIHSFIHSSSRTALFILNSFL